MHDSHLSDRLIRMLEHDKSAHGYCETQISEQGNRVTGVLAADDPISFNLVFLWDFVLIKRQIALWGAILNQWLLAETNCWSLFIHYEKLKSEEITWR